MRILAYTAFLIVVGVWPAAAFDGPTQAAGGKKSASAPGSSAKPGAAKGAAEVKPVSAPPGQKLYSAGIKAYEAGKFSEAIKHLSSAVRSGDLGKPQMAKALYHRGISFRKTGKPGQAISDLTSAVWLREGLTKSQKTDALNNRTDAYREAGISNAPEASESVVVASETASEAASSLSGWETATLGTTSAPPAAKAATLVPDSAVATTPASTPSVGGSSSSASGSESSGGGFFSSITNLFTGGGGSSSKPAPNPSKEDGTTASIAANPKTSSWNQTTQVATAPLPAQPKKPAQVTTPFATQVAAAPPPSKPKKPAQVAPPFATQVAAAPLPSRPKEAPQVAPPIATQAAAAPPPIVAAKPSKPKIAAAPSGKFRLQVAAVRSRSEAERVVENLMQKYAGKFGQRQPVVDEKIIGSMGTFYRVRVGPYANAKEPQKLCGTLRTSGFDCLVVSQ